MDDRGSVKPRRSWTAPPRRRAFVVAVLVACLAVTPALPVFAQEEPVVPPSLKTVPVPVPSNLDGFVADRDAAVRLGKALFWDMQVGSDGVQACASCHFHAGADNRNVNALYPGADGTFTVAPPNATLVASDFPFHRLQDPDDASSTVLFDSDDVGGSQGVFKSAFDWLRLYQWDEWTTPQIDASFTVGGVNVRQVEPRNTPTAIGAVFNQSNFWDGRALPLFNGVSPFGPADQGAAVFTSDGSDLTTEQASIDNGSLGSQAVGPIVSPLEMIAAGRERMELGKKMMTLRPLGKQMVHPEDGVLGDSSRGRLNGAGELRGQPGLRTTYPRMIEDAFQPEYWQDDTHVVVLEPSGETSIQPKPAGQLAANEFTQMEANFSLFFGLSVQLYEATLVPDDTPFDRYREGRGSLTAQELEGLDVFMDRGRCINCHGGAEFTNASVSHVGTQTVELMDMAIGSAFYDNGFYNIGVRPTAEDIGRGADLPFINPLTGDPMPLSFSERAILKRDGLLPAYMDPVTADLPSGTPSPPDRVAVDGAFKTPTLRNVELTGPYLHNGGQATLRQVVDFYTRGGDFAQANIEDLDPDIAPIGGMDEARKDALVAFMLALTDERVRWEISPFDHPQLFVPNGMFEQGGEVVVPTPVRVVFATGFKPGEAVIEVPAVGAQGRASSGLGALRTFLGLDPSSP